MSRQIRELEDELGFALFVRTTRKVELTPAGQVFLDGARSALAALDDAANRALRTSRAVAGRLRVGFAPGAALELTEPIVSAFRSQYPDVELELREWPLADPSCGLRDGTSDVAIVRAPLDEAGLETSVLVSEPVVVAVSSGHRLADRGEVAVRELLDEPITLSRNDDLVHRAFWSLDSHRNGMPPAIVGTDSVTEEAQVVATGAAIAVTAASAARYLPLPGVRYLRVADGLRSTLALAWRDDEPSESLAVRFRECAITVRDRESAIVDLIESPSEPRWPQRSG